MNGIHMKKLQFGYSLVGSAHFAHLLTTTVCKQYSSEINICSEAHIGNVANAEYYVCPSAIACKS